MCGRYALLSSTELLVELFALSGAVPKLEPRYNIAPTQLAPVVRRAPQGRRLDLLRWGLVPSWARDASIGARMINARSETAAGKPAFGEALARRRCLVPADGFFEWRKTGRVRQPYFIRRRDGAPCALAGLWERWSAAGGETIESFTVLTTTPNALVEPLHDRMPVIIEPADFERWLDLDEPDPARLRPLLGPLPAEQMEAHPVSRRVNSPAHDDPACIEPISPASGQEPTLFD